MKRFLLLAPALLVLTGCDTVNWLRPLYTEHDLTTEPAIIGTWREDHGVLTVTARDDVYRFEFKENRSKDKDEDKAEVLEVRLLRLGGELYGDAVEEGPGIPSHSYYRLELVGDELRVFVLNSGWALDQVKAHALRHELVEENHGKDRRFVVTATTAELQNFLCANRFAAWEEAVVLQRVR